MHLYSTLYCVIVHPKRFTIIWGGGGGGGPLLNLHQCAASTWMMQRLPQDNNASAFTTHQLQVERRASQSQSSVCAHHTPATGGEERVIETIKCMLSPHTNYRWRGESHRDNQVYALTTHQLQVERRESHRANQVYAFTTHQLQVERRER